MLDVADTIAAIASAPGGAARGIIRVSGPGTVETVGALFSAPKRVNPHPSPLPRGEGTRIRHAKRIAGELMLGPPLGNVPCDLYLWPNERSYTRQPSAELHLPGAPPILQAALAALCRQGARLAAPGEFTLRAFLAGRMDLTQAEAVLGVIDASSRRELDAALAQLAGGLASPLHALREKLLDLLAHLEAGLDFVEEDIEFISAAELTSQLTDIAADLERLMVQLEQRGTADDAWRIVLAGPPNAGKSSLLNALAGEEAALVSPIAGTTRDYVTRDIVIEGLRCRLIDTAGLADAEQPIEAAAEEQSHGMIEQAHLVLYCRGVDQLDESSSLTSAPCMHVITKWDLHDGGATPARNNAHPVSAHTGHGLSELRQAIAEHVRSLADHAAASLTSARCRYSLASASAALQRAIRDVTHSAGEELIASELRVALDELGRVAGVVYTDDILDRIFSRFCIGK